MIWELIRELTRIVGQINVCVVSAEVVNQSEVEKSKKKIRSMR